MKHSNALLKLLLGSALLFSTFANAQIQSDNFNSGTLSSFWTYINPLGDATQNFTATQARIIVPAGLSHDPIQFGANNAPRLVQQIATPGNDYGNLEVFAKFDATMNAAYQLVGIQIIQNGFNYVRCELFSDGTSIYPLLWAFDNLGNPNPGSPTVGAALPSGSNAPLFLRVKRVDSTFSLYHATSVDSPWTLGATLTHALNVDSIGVYAANSDGTTPGTTAPAFTGLIDYFTTADPLPVQLASFTASVVNQNQVRLHWTTITETNNWGFYVEKSLGNSTNFARIPGSFIPGNGTTIIPHHYSYVDITSPGNWSYRLEQIDLDGTQHFSDPISVDILTSVGNDNATPTAFALKQNYPNPFNPSTVIAFDVPRESRVRLEVFNLIGQKVATAFEGMKAAGRHEVTFNASSLTTGVYLYKLTAGTESFVNRMVLMK